MLRKLDDSILTFFTNLCHRWQKLTGLTNFWMAKMAFLGALPITLFIFCASDFRKESQAAIGVNFFIDAFYFVFLCRIYKTITFPMLDKLEAYYLDGSDTAHPRTQIIREDQISIFFRLELTFLTPLIFFVFLTEFEHSVFALCAAVSFACLPAYMYLEIVVPLPPGKSKIQEWKESFAAGFKQLAPIPSGNK